MTKISVWTDAFARPKKFGNLYSQGLIVPAGQSLLFTTGMTAFNPDGTFHAPGDVVAQTRRIFESMAALLAEAGASMDDVVKMTVYVADRADIRAIQEVRDSIWTKDPPVSATIQVGLHPEVSVEIDAIAVVPGS